MEVSRIDWAVGVLSKVIDNENSRLKTGVIRRQKISETIKAGETPVGVRPDWLRSTALELIDTLNKAAVAFNDSNPDDMISNLDMIDALNTATAWIKNKS